MLLDLLYHMILQCAVEVEHLPKQFYKPCAMALALAIACLGLGLGLSFGHCSSHPLATSLVIPLAFALPLALAAGLGAGAERGAAGSCSSLAICWWPSAASGGNVLAGVTLPKSEASKIIVLGAATPMPW